MNQKLITTEELADQLRIKPQTLRAALCRVGHYYGVTPVKLPNTRLLWPADAADKLTGQPAGSDSNTAILPESVAGREAFRRQAMHDAEVKNADA